MEKLNAPKITQSPSSRLLLLAALATGCGGEAFKSGKSDAGTDSGSSFGGASSTATTAPSETIDTPTIIVPTVMPPLGGMGGVDGMDGGAPVNSVGGGAGGSAGSGGQPIEAGVGGGADNEMGDSVDSGIGGTPNMGGFPTIDAGVPDSGTPDSGTPDGGLDDDDAGMDAGVADGTPVVLPEVYAQCAHNTNLTSMVAGTRELVGQCQVFGTPELTELTMINDTNGDNRPDALPEDGTLELQVICGTFAPEGRWVEVDENGEAHFTGLPDCLTPSGQNSFPVSIYARPDQDMIGSTVSLRWFDPFVDEANSNDPPVFTVVVPANTPDTP